MAFSPEVLPAAVRAIAGAPARQHPVIMITCSPDGRPRVCVPDWGELRVVGERHLRVAVWPSDPTASDLDRDPSVLLIVTAVSEVYLVHAAARRLDHAAMVWAHYELTITSARIADRGTTPRSPSRDADVPEELLTQRPPRAGAALGRKAAAVKARHRNAPQRSPWARPQEPEGRADHRLTERAHP
ncbi:hypothetical protein [Actinomadura sp. WMMA1423]|uniref:hypothetical protein n=1 Tax=Actinomadura sp. WMMA1423 TaxID=2591108 RepID=UPI0011472C5A|nr:hypothetical protein [Actinomadura sp. WMMA1423]